jgi:hypothetical protein
MKRVPKLCRHNGTNRAFVRIQGKMIYLGEWGSPESKERYDHEIELW